MKAVICTRYGTPDVLQLREVKKPFPKDNEVLVKIHAASVSTPDCEIRRFDFPCWVWLPLRLFFGVFRPRIAILGQEFAGEVEAVGKNVSHFREGDRVFGTSGPNLGAYAEYICVSENPTLGTMTKIPANISYQEAAVVPYGGGEALEFLRLANIQAGQKVLIIGAGGSFGSFAIQLAKLSGAEVTAVDSSIKMEMMRSLGADHLVDYTKGPVVEPGQTYDVIFEVIGKPHFSQNVKTLKDTGCYLMANPGFPQLVSGLWTRWTSKKKVIFGAGSGTSKELLYLKELIETGKLRAVIDRCYPLEKMTEAHRYVESGKKIGNVVVNVSQD